MFLAWEGRDWTAKFSSDMVLDWLIHLAKLALVFCREQRNCTVPNKSVVPVVSQPV